MVLLAADDSPDLLRAAMQAGLRDVVSLPLSLEQLESSVRAAAQWSRALRERVAGRGDGRRRARRPADRRRRRQGRRRHHDGRDAPRARRDPRAARAARSASSTSTSRRATCARTWTRRTGAASSTSSRSRDEISVRHLQETLYTHREGVRVLLAPDEGERAEEVDSIVARNVLNAVRARHALTVVDLGADVSEASAIGAEMATKVVIVDDARRRRAARRAAAARAVAAPAGARRRRRTRSSSTAPRASARCSPTSPARSSAGRLAETTIPADFAAFEAAVNTGSPARVEDGKLRGAFDALAAELGVAARAPRRTSPTAATARPARAARRRARPVERRVHGPAAAADRLRARAVADRADRLHVRARRPRRPRGRADARRQPDRRRGGRRAYEVRTRAMGDLPKAWRERRRGRRARRTQSAVA